MLVTGATGVLGDEVARRLVDAGARVALGGRDTDRLESLASELGDAPTVRLDASDLGGCAAAVDEAADALGGLDGLVVAVGVAAFGPAAQLDLHVAQQLMAVNALGPMALVSRALDRLAQAGEGGAVVAMSAVVADHPTAGMAAYSGSKAALSAFLAAARREHRRDGIAVLDVRPPHLDTGFSDRSLAGEPPPLPEPVEASRVVDAVLDGLRRGRREIAWDMSAGEFVVR